MSYTDATDKVSGGSSDMETNANLGDPVKNKQQPIGKGKKKKSSTVNMKPKLKHTIEGLIEKRVNQVMKATLKKRGFNYTKDGPNQAPSSNGPLSSANLFSEAKRARSKIVPKKSDILHTPSRPAPVSIEDQKVYESSVVRNILRSAKAILFEGEVVSLTHKAIKPSSFTGKAEIHASRKPAVAAYDLGYKHGYEGSGERNPYQKEHPHNGYYSQGFVHGTNGFPSTSHNFATKTTLIRK